MNNKQKLHQIKLTQWAARFQMTNFWIFLRRCAMLRDADPDYLKGIYICSFSAESPLP